jgi:hypothetical protein
MSASQILATELLCQLMESDKAEINGKALLCDEHEVAGQHLLKERVLVLGPSLSWVTCPECGVEAAKILREVSSKKIRVRCDECGDIDTGHELQRTYKVNFNHLINLLGISLDFLPSSSKMIVPLKVWRLGISEKIRGKPITWYFARHLNDPAVAKRLLDQLRMDHALQTANIITSSDLPLPEGSLLTGYNVVKLSTIARLSQSRFLFFTERSGSQALPPKEEPLPTTSLRLVRDKGWAFVQSVKYELEGMQKNILLSLIDSHAHRLEGAVLGERCGSEAFPFQPAKFFSRNNEVYKAFVKYVPGDKIYELVIAEEDQDWL